MTEITIITTSPFPGVQQMHEVTFPSLMSQTCRDFKWLFLDGFYNRNRDMMRAFQENSPFEIIHVPLMHDRRSPRKYHWEPYNSALLLCDTKFFLRWGRFRSYHPRAVEESLGHLRNNLAVDFAQAQAEDGAWPSTYDTLSWFPIQHPHSSCGMFGMNVEDMIFRMNGNDEVGLHQNHFEDVEMNGRMKNIPEITCMKTENGLVRYLHNKDCDSLLQMEEPARKGCLSPGCPHTAPTFAGRREAVVRGGHCQKIMINGMDFWTCNNCGAFAPGDADEYRDWVHASGRKQSLIGVAGYGRDLSMVRNAVMKTNILSEKVRIIENSY